MSYFKQINWFYLRPELETSLLPRVRFSKAPETFPARKAIAKISNTYDYRAPLFTLFLTWTRVPFIQEDTGESDTDELKMALRARKVSGAFEKLAHDCITEQGEGAAWGFSGWLTRKWVFAIQTDTSSSPCSQCAVECHQGGGVACICIVLHCTVWDQKQGKKTSTIF